MSFAATKYNPALSVYNLTETSFRLGRAALGTAIAGSTPARILCLGDSITQGVTSTPQKDWNYPRRLRDTLTALGRFGTVGEGLVFPGGQTLANYDTRWTVGTGWSRQNGGLQATMFQAAPGSGTLSFALPSCDTVRIWYTRHSINGTWTFNVDGGSAQSVNANGATAILSSSAFSIGSVGTHTLNIIPNATTGYAMIQAVEYWTAGSRNKLEVVTGGGWNGTMLRDYFSVSNAQAFGAPTLIDAMKPDITIIAFGRNEAASGTYGPAFQAELTSAVQRVRTTNGLEVLLLAPPPSNLPSYPYDGTVRAAIQAVADAQDVAVIDLNRRFGSGWNAGTWPMSSDNLHPNDGGQSVLANTIAGILAA